MTVYEVTVTKEKTEWRLGGKLHRENDPAVEYADGTKVWYVNGNRHRTDGPAVEYANGTKMWFVNGQLHRTDGPAIDYADGTKAWYVNGQRVTEAEVMQPVKELTVAEIEKLLGHRVKVVK